MCPQTFVLRQCILVLGICWLSWTNKWERLSTETKGARWKRSEWIQKGK